MTFDIEPLVLIELNSKPIISMLSESAKLAAPDCKVKVPIKDFMYRSIDDSIQIISSNTGQRRDSISSRQIYIKLLDAWNYGGVKKKFISDFLAEFSTNGEADHGKIR